MEVRHGDQKRTIRVSGLTTLLEVKEWAAGAFGAPLSQLGRVVFASDITENRLPMRDERTFADFPHAKPLFIRCVYRIEFEPIA